AYGLPLAPALRLRLSAGVTMADSNYMQTFFGVSDAQAATSGYAPHRAGAGVRDTRLGAMLLYVPAQHWAIAGGLNFSQLNGDARTSPLTRERSSVGAVATVGFAF
ncbi:MAG: MipA/OmpV family protein, partial [Rubrivivax sp.]